jgi:hypothetical protein
LKPQFGYACNTLKQIKFPTHPALTGNMVKNKTLQTAERISVSDALQKPLHKELSNFK